MRAAAGEGIVEPEIAAFCDSVGDVGETRRALVRSDDEIGIFAVMDDDRFRMDHLAVDDVVGDRQQRANENLVARLPFGSPAGAVAGGIGEELGIEAALRPGWDDHRVLDPLGFHQTEDFGAEIVAAIGPAQAAAGNRSGAQVDAFDTARIDEDLAPGDRLGQVRNQFRFDLERQCFVRGGRERIGPQDRIDQRVVEPQQAIVVDGGDLGQRAFDTCLGGLDRLIARSAELRIVACIEHCDQGACNLRRAAQRIDDGVDGKAHPGLAQIAIEGAQPVGFLRRQGDFRDKPVEAIVLRLAVENSGDRFLDRFGASDHALRIIAFGERKAEIVDRAEPSFVELGRHFGQYVEAEVFERRNRVAQRQTAFCLIQLEPQAIGCIAIVTVEPRVALARGIAVGVLAKSAQPADIACGLGGSETGTERGRERFRPA